MSRQLNDNNSNDYRIGRSRRPRITILETHSESPEGNRGESYRGSTSVYNRGNRLAPPTPAHSPVRGSPISRSRTHHPQSFGSRLERIATFRWMERLRASTSNSESISRRLSSGGSRQFTEAADPEANVIENILPQQATTVPVSSRRQQQEHAQTNSATLSADTIEENYWPNITRWLETGEGPKPVVNCTICCVAKLAIPGLQEANASSSSANNNNNDDGEFEPYHILQCGHVFGAECVSRWVFECFNSTALTSGGPRCPMCREPVYSDLDEMLAAQERAAEVQRMELIQRNLERIEALRRSGRALLRPAGVGLMDVDDDDDDYEEEEEDYDGYDTDIDA